MLTAQPPEHDFVKTLSATAATSDFRNQKKVEKTVVAFVCLPIGSTTFQKQNVNISWDVRQSSLVALTACGPQHIFIFVILNWEFVIKLNTSDLNASEFIGNSWQNTHESKSVKSENVQNDQKVKKLKSIGNSWQNSQEDVLKRISSSRQKITSDQISRRRHIIYNKYYYNRRALRVI